MEAPASVEESFHINKILDYLPVIIISVIFLVGFFTWDVVRNEMASFMMLILMFVYALWVRIGDAKSYKLWLNEDSKYIFPKINDANNPFKDKGIWLGLAIFIFIVLGLGLGFGSIGISKSTGNTTNTVNTLNVFGSLFSIGGIVLVIYSLWKIFRDDGSVAEGDAQVAANAESDKPNTKRAGLGGFIGSVLGFYMIARAKTIENDEKELVNDKAKADYQANPVNNGASAALVSGLVLQVIGYALVFAVLYFNNKFTLGIGLNSGFAVNAVLIIGFILCGILWIGTSQGWPGLKIGDGSVGDFNSNVFAAHGGIYIIFAVIFLVSTLGKLEKSITYYSFGWVLVVLFAGCYIWNWIVMSEQNRKDSITEEQKDILREEVRKELKRTAPGGVEVTPEVVNDAVVERIQAKQKPSEIVNGVFSSLSVVIILMITIFHNMRLRLGICGKFPLDSGGFVAGFVSWGKNLFRSLMPPTDPANPDSGYCTDLTDNILEATKKTKAYDKVKTGEIDNVTGTEWDSLLNTYKEGELTNINKLIVRTAKGAMWIPFLLMIILIMWVAIVFTRVSTSEATNVWIAKSFSGDMFPKVKELIDTFFIVLIIGLLLCGILLLPMVKELNVGGLSSMLNFAESIQVWQYNHRDIGNQIVPIIATLFMSIVILGAGFGTLFTHDLVPKDTKWIVSILIVLIALCFSPVWYSITSSPDPAFKNESIVIRFVRMFFTGVYLIPWFIFTIFKLVLFGIPGFFNKEMRDKRDEELKKLAFWNWAPNDTDLRIFAIGGKLTPESVTSMPPMTEAVPAGPDSGTNTNETETTKISAIGKLIKAVLLIVSFVTMILATIYIVYKVGAGNRSPEQDAASGGLAAQLNSPTAQVIYVIMTIVAVAGFVAYIREKFTKANRKTPEDYLFDDYKPEDTTKPMRQLTFSMTHVIYIVLMAIVWVYDTDKDGNPTMTGMTVLGIAILFFHYGLEFIDNKEPGTGGTGEPKMASMANLLTNIRFIVNTIFFIILCVLAYYKQHSVMVVLIVFMFLFHITKSILGMKLLRLVWLCIIYIPCLFLGLLTKSQGAVGDTTRPIWIILAIEIILATILFGGPYLLNYIGASNSQIIAAPVPLQPKHDTGLTTQSPQIFIFHNTALNRSDSDKAANCAPEEKKRYNYSVSGWFWINNNVNTRDKDLEIFNFGGVPKLTYNPGTTEFKVSCKTVSLSTGMPDASANIVYNSRSNYHNTKNLSNIQKTKLDILNDSHTTDIQIPIQKWNYFVINFDGKSMDVFLNNTLVAKSDFFVPDITMQSITSGDDGGSPAKPEGLSGNVCNISFHKEPLSLEQIRWTYTMLKSREPPMVGMKTIADEVKTTGTANIYS